MHEVPVKPTHPHLQASLLALAGVALVLAVSTPVFQSLGNKRLRDLMVMPIKLKDQGEWLQREAFLHYDVLPVYGSSELTLDVKNRANEVFRYQPTGFQISPVGGPGDTSIMMAEKLAALGERIREKKIVLIFSSSWFFRKGVPDDSYAGNFSPLQAVRLLENEALEAGLRKRFLARMLEFPDTLNERPVLGIYVRNSAKVGAWSGLKRAVIQPLLEAQKAKLSWEDFFATANEALNLRTIKGSWSPEPQDMDWDKRITQMEAQEAAANRDNIIPKRLQENGAHDGEFLADIDASREWEDFRLLLDTLNFFGARAVLISVPIGGTGYDRRGVSRVARDGFYHRFESLCAKHGYRAVTFSDHDLDDGFTIPRSSHFTPKGWLYVDRVLDDFYHDRPLGKERK